MSTYVRRRKCQGACGKNRAEKFFRSPKGRICIYCQRENRRKQTRELRVKNTYGMSKDDMQALLEEQGGLCAICRGKRDVLDVDHDHTLERELLGRGYTAEEAARLSVRGLLCARCNRQLLKHARNSPSVLRAAALYLDNPTWWSLRERLDGEA